MRPGPWSILAAAQAVRWSTIRFVRSFTAIATLTTRVALHPTVFNIVPRQTLQGEKVHHFHVFYIHEAPLHDVPAPVTSSVPRNARKLNLGLSPRNARSWSIASSSTFVTQQALKPDLT